MSIQTVPLGTRVEIIAGQHIEAALYGNEASGTPYLTGPDDFGEKFPKIKKWTSHPKVFSKSGDVLVTVKGAGVGKSNLGCDAAIGRQLMALRPIFGAALQSFIYHFIRFKFDEIARLADGATVPGIGKNDLASLRVPLLSIDEQRRLAAVLDQADALRQKRRIGLELLDRLSGATFAELFGDPATNRSGFSVYPLGSLSIAFSDGPFGSNLKSEHYVDDGVRVIRLQNIGVGEFIDRDRAYISEEHFRRLSRHKCRPRDILIGTLGDPNLRACLQPDHLKVALNKADCVQMRCDESKVLPEYIEALLNHPSTARMAADKIQGQTRLRISMGRLRQMAVPVPPISLQREFADRIVVLRRLQKGFADHLEALDALFASLQHRAFAGEL